MLALEDLLETAHGVRDRHQLALATREALGDVERLGQEPLDLARPRHGELVVLGKLLHAEDRDDVLQILVALQHLLHALRRVVVVLADDGRLDEPARRPERVDRRVDADLHERPLETERCAEVREHGLDGGVGVVVGRHVHGLHRRDRALASGRDALFQLAHLGGQRRLVAHGRWHAAEQRRNLGAREQVPEDVVDEEQRVSALLVAEVLGHGQTGEAHSSACARRLVHLAEHERRLRQHARVLHLLVHVVAFAGPLADPGEHGAALVVVGDVADQLLHDHRLASARSAKQADLRALGERADEVDDLDAGLQDLDLRLLLGHRRRRTVDGPACDAFGRGLVVNGRADHVEHASERLDADWHRDGRAGRDHLVAAPETVCGVHGDAAHDVVADSALDLEHDDSPALGTDLESLEELGLIAGRELDIHNCANDLADLAVTSLALRWRHRFPLGYLSAARMASAPLTISISSVVMPAWRTLFA